MKLGSAGESRRMGYVGLDVLQERYHSVDFRGLGGQLEPFVSVTAKLDKEFIVHPINRPCLRVLVGSQSSGQPPTRFTRLAARQVLRRKNIHESKFFGARPRAYGCRAWQDSAPFFSGTVLPRSVLRCFSAIFDHLFVPSQQSLWPDCGAESELLAMST
jgi:hypothetical protein